MRQPGAGEQWYTRRDGVIRGPFGADSIARYILLGRIRLDDEISEDRASWQSVRLIASILPDEVNHLTSWEGYQRFIVSRMKLDERKLERRQGHDTYHGAERRSGSERRVEDGALSLARYIFGEADISASGKKRSPRLGVLVLTLVLAVLVFAWLVPAAR